MLFVVCCSLRVVVVCCLLFVVCCVLSRVVRCLWVVVLLFDYWLLVVVR